MAKKDMIFFLLVFLLITGTACTSEKADNNINSKIKQDNSLDKASNEEQQNDEPSDVEVTVYNPLTDEYIKELHKPEAVMIDNLYTARPQHGIEMADVVYEAEAEGNITRFMAIFYGENPEKVGPVRSARPYFLKLVKPWNLHYVHVGGSMKAYADISRLNIKSIDNMKGGQGFINDSSRRAPHNTYFRLEEVMRYRATSIDFPGWDFTIQKEVDPAYSTIKFKYNDNNNPRYEYNSQKEEYLRYINNKAHTDKLTGEQVGAKNIIFQRATHVYTGDKFGHIKINLQGQGKAEYFLGGRYETGYWKSSSRGHIKYYDKDGNQIKFVPGKTWIQIIRPGTKIIKS
ncbi:MAG: DUF3048 domain-containing protein [Clostridiales bacterium]|nr:DUF3048 domain-containing protein [Clostridiales bacterium]MCF8023285.1 DUF3048 domain-containing protein [Clostridiales bacterium]